MPTSNPYILGGIGGGNDVYTVALLHFNGTNDSQVFTDDAVGGSNTWSVNAGTPQLKTAEKKFGTASLYLNGAASIKSADSLDWYFNGDFTIDCWIKPTAQTTYMTLWDQYLSSGGIYSINWNFYVYNPDANFYTEYLQREATTFTILAQKSVATPYYNVWSHVAVTRAGDIFRFFLNGVQVGTDFTDTTVGIDIASILKIGYNTTAGYAFTGYVDEMRVSKGIARWTSGFTPPSKEYY